MTLVITWSGLGLGMGESTILTEGPEETMASFIVDAAKIFRKGESRDGEERSEANRGCQVWGNRKELGGSPPFQTYERSAGHALQMRIFNILCDRAVRIRLRVLGAASTQCFGTLPCTLPIVPSGDGSPVLNHIIRGALHIPLAVTLFRLGSLMSSEVRTDGNAGLHVGMAGEGTELAPWRPDFTLIVL